MRPTVAMTARGMSCLLLALVLLVATVATTVHGHTGDSTPCASCMFAGSSGLRSEAPRLPQPVALLRSAPVALPVPPAFVPAPLIVAPKLGPPARA